jgi:Trypsin-co-occurring domain 2
MNDELDLSLKDLIRAVSNELRASREERLAEQQPAIWEVSELTIEANFVVTASAGGSGGFDLKILKADAQIDHSEQTVHKVVVTLKALADDEGLPELGDELPLRPRMSD